MVVVPLLVVIIVVILEVNDEMKEGMITHLPETKDQVVLGPPRTRVMMIRGIAIAVATTQATTDSALPEILEIGENVRRKKVTTRQTISNCQAYQMSLDSGNGDLK